MTDVKLSDGRELSVDLAKITVREYRLLFDPKQAADDGDEPVARCLGLSAEELRALTLPDYRRAVAAFFEATREPLANPLSPSESTKPS